ncbi:MAG: hypothetical protein ACUVXB_06725 [Bryobacteraceae bacterium]
MPSAGDAYPYPIKVLFLYMGSPVYALPAGHSLIPILREPDKIPLIVSSDITIDETTLYADYVFPDLTYLDRWEFHRTHPSIVRRVSPGREPVIPSLTETVRIFGKEMPVSMEAVFSAIAEQLGLPGFGPGGLVDGNLDRPEDYYLRMVANMPLAAPAAAPASVQTPPPKKWRYSWRLAATCRLRSSIRRDGRPRWATPGGKRWSTS